MAETPTVYSAFCSIESILPGLEMQATTGELALASVEFHSMPEGVGSTLRDGRASWKLQVWLIIGCYFSLPNSTTDQRWLLL